ncbi:MAG: CBS domain-containing protein [Candidatus Nanoarchaeia archaeon]|jgi:predicted transcriptional regulator
MINSIMSKKLVTITPDNTISDAMNLMDNHHYKELPVIDKKNRVLGLITYSNILGIVKFNGNSKIDNYIEGIPIVHENDSEQYVLDLMINSGLMGLPVVDENEVLKGFVSDYDLINFYKDRLKAVPLTDVNVKKVPSVKESTTLGETKNILLFNKRDRLPVVDSKGEFIGTILLLDILRRIYKNESNKKDKNGMSKRNSMVSTQNTSSKKNNVLINPINDLVRKGIKISFDSDLFQTAEMMLKNQLLGLIIVNSDNQPLGAVDRCSILKLLRDINTDNEIKVDIVGEVNRNAVDEIKKIIKTQLKLLPSYQSSIKGIKVFIKRVHDDQGEGKVDVRLTLNREGSNDLLIQKTDYDILLTLMDCIDNANTLLKNKVKK